MGIRRDHILRLIERAGPMLKKIFGLQKMQETKGSIQLVREACKELLGLDLGLVLTMPVDGLRQLLAIDEGTGVGRCLVAAELLRSQADANEAQDEAGARELRAKAAVLEAWVLKQPGGKEYVEAFASLRSDGSHTA